MKAIISLCLIFLSYDLALGQKKHTIDTFLEDCLAKSAAQTTSGSVDCVGQAYKMWDDELNLQYKSVMSSMTPAQQQQLKNTQIQWLKFRDTEFNMIDVIYADQGTMGLQLRLNDKLEFVRQRALHLKSMHELVHK